MKIAAHITFFYSPKRLQYLQKVVDGLLEIDQNIEIFIYTNKKPTLYTKNSNIKYKVFSYRKFLIARFSKKSFLNKIGFKWLIHPFYLAWENRKFIESMVDYYDVQIYLEDDILFKKENFKYWLEYKKKVISNNYNLGFLRFEIDGTKRMLLTDVNWPLSELIEMEGQKFILNNLNPYCGFWIMDKDELKKFIKSPEWNFEFDGYGVRAKAAVGWHGKNMDRYKGSIIPLTTHDNGLATPIESVVHHLPNNYIGKGRYCSIEFPLIYPDE